MYKGWIICSENFQKMSGFKYKGRHKRHNSKYKYFECEVTDNQLKGMLDNWEKFKDIEIEWDLKKKVSSANGLSEGEVLLQLIGYNRYFFNKYENLYKYSQLKEWKEYNGIQMFSMGRNVSSGYIADVSHIRDDLSTYRTFTKCIDSNEKLHSYDIPKIDSQVSILLNIKNKLKTLNESH